MLAALLVGEMQSAIAQVTGVSYTLSPIGTRVYWDDDAGLDDGYMYGGELGLGFGEFVELGGLYLQGTSFETDFSDFSTNNDAILDRLALLESRDVEVQRYGGKLRLNIGTGNIVPFLTGGTGILRFDVDGTGEHEQIYLNGGAGITLSLADRYTLSLAAERLAYRYNPGTVFFTDADLAAVGLQRTDFNSQEVANWAATASLKFYLGGRAEGELTDIDRALQNQFRGGGFGLAVDPFYGQINFADELQGVFGEDQRLAGVNAGFDLGPYLGLRGFYWRSVEDEDALDSDLPEEFGDLALYGGELNFRFGGGSGLTSGLSPFLILGGGYADVDGNFDEDSEESRYFATGGIGIDLPLSSALTIQGAARSVLMSTQDAEDLSEPSNVFASWMYTAGLSFTLGADGRTAGSAIERRLAQQEAEREEQQERIEAELARIQARLDSLDQAGPRTLPMAMRTEERLVMDTTVVDGDTVIVRERRITERPGDGARTARETVTLPVPETGEIYIRFGEPPQTRTYVAPGLAIAMGDSMMQQRSMQQRVQPAGRQDTTVIRVEGGDQRRMAEDDYEDRLEELEDRLERQYQRQIDDLRDDLREARRDQDRTDVNVTTGGGAVQRDTVYVVPDSVSTADGLIAQFQQRELVGASPLIGVRVGEGAEVFLIGGRADFRFPGRKVRFLPEATIGFGEATALSLFGNLAVPLELSERRLAVQPYVGAGIGVVTDGGLFSGPDLALNLLAGAEYTTPNGLTFFGEFSTLDFFDFNRILVGYRFRF